MDAHPVSPTIYRSFFFLKKIVKHVWNNNNKNKNQKLTEKCPVDGCAIICDDSVYQLAQSDWIMFRLVHVLMSIVWNVIEILCPVDDQMLLAILRRSVAYQSTFSSSPENEDIT